ncbi:hypothetical protein NDU88_004345 [Pleurodeles waltl]|uniref:Uncharacterized protein n=1 Tax=Pleurodeles waltl TaxID=8319 RepID=A0AAV7VK34_PLEWA|nr:hypothetical protein NDU88_004345 [Pleurodeles waltl]
MPLAGRRLHGPLLDTAERQGGRSQDRLFRRERLRALVRASLASQGHLLPQFLFTSSPHGSQSFPYRSHVLCGKIVSVVATAQSAIGACPLPESAAFAACHAAHASPLSRSVPALCGITVLSLTVL